MDYLQRNKHKMFLAISFSFERLLLCTYILPSGHFYTVISHISAKKFHITFSQIAHAIAFHFQKKQNTHKKRR